MFGARPDPSHYRSATPIVQTDPRCGILPLPDETRPARASAGAAARRCSFRAMPCTASTGEVRRRHGLTPARWSGVWQRGTGRRRARARRGAGSSPGAGSRYLHWRSAVRDPPPRLASPREGVHRRRVMRPHSRWHSLLATGLLVTTLLGAPGMTSGRFVCLRGMARAGASCPLCHRDGASPAGSCCKWVDAAPLRAIHVARASLDPPTNVGHVPHALMEHVGGEPSSDAGSIHPAVCPATGPPSRTTILRL